jgi:DNA-binding LacI/PurR family transcriptional regulator
VAHFFAQPEKPTAILAFNDLMALGALQALADRRLRVPTDVAVVGFDDIPLSQFTNPALTTVRQPLADMCTAAMDLLLQRIRGDAPSNPQYVVLEPELVIRSSTVRQSTIAYSGSPKEVAYARSDIR